MSFNTEVQPGICMEPDAITQEYVFNHTMLRVKDPKRSLDFYSRVLGMRLLRRLDFEEGRFSLYFLAMTRGEEVPDALDERQRYTFGRQSVLELTHNWGSESDDSQYHNGNQDPRGSATSASRCPTWWRPASVRTLGVNFVKPLDRGMKNVAFISDPDGYWVEIVQASLNGEMGRG